MTIYRWLVLAAVLAGLASMAVSCPGLGDVNVHDAVYSGLPISDSDRDDLKAMPSTADRVTLVDHINTAAATCPGATLVAVRDASGKLTNFVCPANK